MSKKRINYSSSFKAKVALSAVRHERTISELSSQFHVHPNQISKWKAVLLDNMEVLFRDGRQRKPQDDADINELYAKIGRLEMENDFLKKNLPSLVEVCHAIDLADSLLSLRHQCRLLNSCQSTFYYTPIPVASAELELMAVFEKFHFEHPYYGSRRLAIQFRMSRDKAQRLMRDLHLVATYPKPQTTTPNSEHKKFPYLLRNILPAYPNHIWSTDIAYIAMSHGFMYLTAIIDWYSRMILSWRISNTMDAHFCRECLQEVFDCFGEPEYFNSDQGVQFTSSQYLKLFDGRATKNSMDGKGRWVDNVIIERFGWS